ncbi:LicD family protein [Butyrivibrio sp. VCB2006]|uniref:LicD family protein n=1 Tax=Butyrivibrio sp. VCB2006 TaxID=1280679 RepID=UPI000413EEF5|nr:LicD family protein [Butyrivibrio sp. VCB2006]
MRHGIDFFRDEIRNGFYVPTALKQSWATALDVLAEIDRICRKFDIKYYADWGTILGAVRHGGFVPWDDDLDICMLRDDYEKFMRVADMELPENFCVHDFERHQNHWLFLSRVVNNNHIRFDEEHLDNNYNFPWLTGVDIFVRDYLYKDPEREKKRCDEVMHLLAQAEPYIKTSNEDKDASKRENARQKAISLYKQAREKMSEVPRSEADYVGQIFPWVLKGLAGEPLEFYQEITYLPFEDTLIPVPAQYNKALERRYGDYNRIVKGAAGHDFPSFEGQRKAFEEETGASLPRFSFDKGMLERPVTGALGDDAQLHKSSDRESGRREVLFLPIGPAEWKSLESAFIAECANADTDVYVVPLPLMHRDIYGQIKATDEEIIAAEHFDDYVGIINALSAKDSEIYSGSNCGECIEDSGQIDNCCKTGVNTDNVYLVGFTDYDLEQHCPDRIYIQSSYDAQNPVLTIPPYYYSDNLRQFTPELIYIPLGPVGEFSEKDIPDMKCMDFYVTMPGPIYADKIIVQSENIRGHYVNKLCEFCPGTTREYWEEKIAVDEEIYSGGILTVGDSDSKKNGVKKRILYGISSYESVEHIENYDEKIKSRMDIFSKNSDKIDVEVFHYPEDVAKTSNLGEMRALVGSFDAYYGSSMPIVQEFIAQRKPVMIANYDI